MSRVPFLILLLSLSGCSKISPSPAPLPAAAENPPLTNCETRSVSAEMAAVAKAEKARVPLEAATKTEPSPTNFRALLEFERTLAKRAELARLFIESCPGVSAEDVEVLRATEKTAAANLLYLEESLSSSPSR